MVQDFVTQSILVTFDLLLEWEQDVDWQKTNWAKKPTGKPTRAKPLEANFKIVNCKWILYPNFPSISPGDILSNPVSTNGKPQLDGF